MIRQIASREYRFDVHRPDPKGGNCRHPDTVPSRDEGGLHGRETQCPKRH